jgi:hypothetical protein
MSAKRLPVCAKLTVSDCGSTARRNAAISATIKLPGPGLLVEHSNSDGQLQLLHNATKYASHCGHPEPDRHRSGALVDNVSAEQPSDWPHVRPHDPDIAEHDGTHCSGTCSYV